MLTVNLWSPDTCGCVLHVVFDDSDPAVPVKFATLDQAVQIHRDRFLARPATTKNPDLEPQPPAVICSAHASLGHTSSRHDAVMGENRRKNIAFAVAQANIPNITPEQYRWNFDLNRALSMSFSGVSVSPQQKIAIQAACDIQFGPGLVAVS